MRLRRALIAPPQQEVVAPHGPALWGEALQELQGLEGTDLASGAEVFPRLSLVELVGSAAPGREDDLFREGEGSDGEARHPRDQIGSTDASPLGFSRVGGEVVA